MRHFLSSPVYWSVHTESLRKRSLLQERRATFS